jgi:nitric oxide synthase oxygenase domain/subunit
MDSFILQTLNGISYSALLFLLASGFTLTFGLMRVVNMAHGAYYLVGGYIGLMIAKLTGSLVAALIAGGCAGMLIGFLSDQMLIRRAGSDHLAQVLITVGIAYIIGDLSLKTWGGDAQKLPLPMDLRGVIEFPGGIVYPTALFNGWYMGTEIGARNLVDPDRYDGLTALGRILGLDQSREDTLWRDEALVILNQAVLESFSKAGVTMIDHHTATADFMKFCDREKRSGRAVQADWSWMIPPLSPAATPVWNADWPNQEQDPRLLQNPPSASH